MGDVHRRGTAARRERIERRDERFAPREIEAARRLVEQEQLLLAKERTREEDALSLPLGAETDRSLGESATADALERRRCGDAVGVRELRPPRCEVAVSAGEGDLERGRFAGQGRGNPLPDRPDAAAHHPEIDPSERATEHRRASRRRMTVGADDREQGALSRSVRSEHHPVLAGCDDEVDRPEDSAVSDGHGDPDELDGGRQRHRATMPHRNRHDGLVVDVIRAPLAN